MHVAGGVEAFLEDHAVIVMSDHSQTSVEDRLNLADALPSWRLLGPADAVPEDAEIAVCPSARAATVYVLEESLRERLTRRAVRDLRAVDGLDLIVHREGGDAAVWSHRGELRFRAGGELVDRRGGRWSVEGAHEALDLRVEDALVSSVLYPDALGRLWSALECPHAGDVLLSAAPGFEFVDWGGADHVGGGSHGSLHRGDSLGVLLMSGIDAPPPDRPEGWSIADVTRLILDHFALSS
jgi:hypothetical protein